MYLEIKKHKENVEVNVFATKTSKSQYHNIVTRDPNRLAQVLIDLLVQGFPVEKAIKIVRERIKKHDWMGV